MLDLHADQDLLRALSYVVTCFSALTVPDTCDRHTYVMTIQELEQMEDLARRGLPIDPESILMLTAYLRDVLQAKASAEAVASEALKRAGLNSRYHAAGVGPGS